MTDTLPYDKRGSYSILHNHLRAYEQARLQKLAEGHGDVAARARMRLNNLNLQADAARRVRQDSDVTLVAGSGSKLATLPDDSETEGEDERMGKRQQGTAQVMTDGQQNKEQVVVLEKELLPGKSKKKGSRRESIKNKMSKVSFAAFSGYVPKPKGPEFAIYPI